MPQSDKKVSIGSLWKQFLPLSLSDVTMAFGDPAITATLAQLPNARVNLAAVGVAKSLAVFFESPIIMLLHASNSLAGARKSRTALWRFTLLSIGILSGLMLILALPPVFGFFARNILSIPVDIEPSARVVLTLMILWPAAIAWRRYFQGILIHSGNGSTVAKAGVLRLLVVAGILISGYFLGLPGAILAAIALVAGILSEAVAVTVPARRIDLPEEGSSRSCPGTVKDVFRFYWPLANSMVVVWGGRVLLIAVIARAVDAPIALAVWPASWGLVLLIANSTRMVQQVIIRNRHVVATRNLIYFVVSVGAAASGILLFLSVTAVGKKAIAAFVGFDAALFEGVLPVLLLCSLVPMLVAIQNAVQGFLIGDGKTQRVNIATWIGTAVLLASATIAVDRQAPGAVAAAISMVLALLSETAVLVRGVYAFKKTNRRDLNGENRKIAFSGVRA